MTYRTKTFGKCASRTINPVSNFFVRSIDLSRIRRRYIGPNGRLRASHREVVPEKLDGLTEEDYRSLMGPAYVYHPHNSTQPLFKGEVVELEISLWPGGMVFDAGEGLSLEIKGRHPIMPEFAGLDEKIVNYNDGRHRVHTGGARPSQLILSLKRGGSA